MRVAHDLDIANVPSTYMRTGPSITLNPLFKIYNNGPLSQDTTIKYLVLDPQGKTVYSETKTIFIPAYTQIDDNETFTFNSDNDGMHTLYAEILTNSTPHPTAEKSINVINEANIPPFPHHWNTPKEELNIPPFPPLIPQLTIISLIIIILAIVIYKHRKKKW